MTQSLQSKSWLDTVPRSAGGIWLLNLGLLVVAVFVPFAGHLLWAITMRQYRLNRAVRIMIALLSYAFGAILIVLGIFATEGDTDHYVYRLLIPGALLFLMPFIYTFIKPLPSSQ